MPISLLFVFATVLILSLVDFLPRIISLSKQAIVVKSYRNSKLSFKILVSVYGDISYFKNIDFLQQYAEHVVVCTTRQESEKFYQDLSGICSEYGFDQIRVSAVSSGTIIKSPYFIFKRVLPFYTKFENILLLDADTYATNNLYNLFATFEQSGKDLCSLKVLVSNIKNVITKLQNIEYINAMDSRRLDPWQTSGAAMIGKTQVLLRIFRCHSNYFEGGDIEIGRLAKAMNYQIGYILFNFYTEVPDSFKAWFRQRVMWFSGGFRQAIINIDFYSHQHYAYFFYNTVILYILMPIRWVELINFPLATIFLLLISWAFIFSITDHEYFGWYLILVPFYSFLQSMIILPLGIIRYFWIVFKQNNWGRLGLDYQEKTWIEQIWQQINNYAGGLAGLATGVLITYQRLLYWSQHGHILQSLKSFIGTIVL